MLGDPWMVRRALEGNIHCQFHIAIMEFMDEEVEIGKAAEFGQHRKMSALPGTDRPGAAHVAISRFCRVVLALAETASNGMNRRQIQNVEAHVRYIIELRRNIAQCAMLTRL